MVRVLLSHADKVGGLGVGALLRSRAHRQGGRLDRLPAEALAVVNVSDAPDAEDADVARHPGQERGDLIAGREPGGEQPLVGAPLRRAVPADGRLPLDAEHQRRRHP
jgi:hypothetical protein